MVSDAMRQLFKSRAMRVEQLERRDLFATDILQAEGEPMDFLTPAYSLLHERVGFVRNFYVYKDAANLHGQPSGFIAGDSNGDRPDLRSAVEVNTACLSESSSATGCSSNPNALDRLRGTVMQVTAPPLVHAGEFAGISFVEGLDAGQGYDLSDTTHVLLDVRSPTTTKVQFTIGSKNTDHGSPYQIPNSWTSISIPLNSLRDPATNFPSLPDLANLRSLFGVVFSHDFSGGGSIQMDNIRFARVDGNAEFPPANPTGNPRIGLPVGTESFGVVPAPLHVEDDGATSFHTISGNWNNLIAANAYEGDQHVALLSGDGPSPAAEWTLDNLEPRNYVVQTTWLAGTNNTTLAKYELLDGSVSRAFFSIDQTQTPADAQFDGSAWQTLGTVLVESGTLIVKVSSDDANGSLLADAVRIVPTIPPDQAFANLATVYEAALTLDVLLQRGLSEDLVAARLIADSIVYAQRHDDRSGGAGLPVTTEGHRGIRDAYVSGDLPLRNDQANGATAGQIRLAGFSSDERLCGASQYCLVLDGATGGNSAFVIMALMSAYFEFHDSNYLDAADELGGWIVGNLTDPNGPAFNTDVNTQSFGGYFLGYPDQGVPKDRVTSLLHGKSIENNADIYAAFTILALAHAATGDDVKAVLWDQRANIAGDFVMAMYSPGLETDSTDGHFYGGTLPFGDNGPPRGPGLEPDGPRRGDDVINVASFLDSNTFSVLALASSSRYHDWLVSPGKSIDWREPIRYVAKTFAQDITVTVDSTPHELQGFSLTAQPTASQFRPGGPIGGLPSGIAWEFVGQTIVAMRVVDDLYHASEFSSTIQKYLAQLEIAQSIASFTDGRGLVASTLNGESNTGTYPPLDQCLGTPFQCIPERVGLAATTWGIAANTFHNIFFISPWHNPVEPLDVNHDRFVTALDALLVINRINTRGSDKLSIPPALDAPADVFYDVDGSGFAVPLDALLIINRLNQNPGGAEGEWIEDPSSTYSTNQPAQVFACPLAIAKLLDTVTSGFFSNRPNPREEPQTPRLLAASHELAKFADLYANDRHSFGRGGNNWTEPRTPSAELETGLDVLAADVFKKLRSNK